MSYKVLNALFDTILTEDNLVYVGHCSNLYVLPSSDKYGKFLDVIMKGKIIDRFYFSTDVLNILFPEANIICKRDVYNFLSQRDNISTDDILVLSKTFLKVVDSHNTGRYRDLYDRYEILIPKSKLEEFINCQ